MADKNYKARMQEIRAKRDKFRSQREKNIVNRVGKALMWGEKQIVEYIADDKIPTQMQHCILKVNKKVSGSDMEKFISAFNICGWVFTTYGYQRPNSMILTSKGLRNNMMHRREVDAGDKRVRYKSLEQRLYGAAAEDLIKEREEISKEKYEKFKEKKEESTIPRVKAVQSTKKATKASTRMKRDE